MVTVLLLNGKILKMSHKYSNEQQVNMVFLQHKTATQLSQCIRNFATLKFHPIAKPNLKMNVYEFCKDNLYIHLVVLH